MSCLVVVLTSLPLTGTVSGGNQHFDKELTHLNEGKILH